MTLAAFEDLKASFFSVAALSFQSARSGRPGGAAAVGQEMGLLVPGDFDLVCVIFLGDLDIDFRLACRGFECAHSHPKSRLLLGTVDASHHASLPNQTIL